MNKIISITNGDLKINLNIDFLNYSKEQLLDSYDLEDMFFKGKKLEKSVLENEVNRLYNLALSIIENNDLTIFDYLPLTKKNLFHKSKNILLAKSDIQKVYNYDYFHSDTLSLQLVPVSYVDKVNPFKNSYTGTGKEVNIELGWFPTKTEEPIINEKGEFVKVVPKKRNIYLKQDDVKIGYVYKDAKDNEFLYIGDIVNIRCNAYYDDNARICHRKQEKIYSSLNEYYQSDSYKIFLESVQGGCICVEPSFEYIKLSKKLKEQLKDAKNITDAYDYLQNEYFKKGNFPSGYRCRENPLKVISEEYKMIEDFFEEKLYLWKELQLQEYCIDFRDVQKLKNK